MSSHDSWRNHQRPTANSFSTRGAAASRYRWRTVAIGPCRSVVITTSPRSIRHWYLIARRPAACAWIFPPAPPCALSRVSNAGTTGGLQRRSHGDRVSRRGHGSTGRTRRRGVNHALHHQPPRLCRHVWPHRRGPHPSGGHGTVHHGRGGSHRLRRGSEIRWRQGDPRWHGSVAGQPGRRARWTR